MPPSAAKRARPAVAPAPAYDASAIEVLHGLAPVRARPGMYIGSTGRDGLHHLVWEVLDNAVDEAMGGHCTVIVVTLHADGSVSVQDNGRGIPTDLHPVEQKSGVELALTVLHAGGKFKKAAYGKTGGLHGVGVSVVNALSSWVRVTVDQHGKRHEMAFADGGRPTGPLTVVGRAKARGTMVRFQPDPTIFTETVVFDYDTIAARLRQTAFLNAGLAITLRDERDAGRAPEIFRYTKGLVEMVAGLAQDRTPVHPDVIHLSGAVDGVDVEVALQYNTGYGETFCSFANNVRTPDGGTHETGFRAALTNVLQGIQAALGTRAQQKLDLQGTDLREGLVAVVAVRVADPEFQGQTKSRINNVGLRATVQTFVADGLRAYFAKHPKTAKAILEKACRAAGARDAARKARDAARAEKSLLDTAVLPGKLKDCSSNDPARNELFLVEGDSAGGSAQQGRDRSHQAVLPLRGKIMNVWKAAPAKVLESEEVRAIITALGTGILDSFSLENLRYHAVIIATDADVDGAHIRTLLLTLFFRFLPEVIRAGHLYIAQPPLYRVAKGKAVRYVHTSEERDAALRAIGDSAVVTRYKGLGEMDASTLAETTMAPATRTLLRVTIEDAAVAAARFELLMGEVPAGRREWIRERARFANVDA